MSVVFSLLQKLSRRLIYERRAARRRTSSVPARLRIRSGNRTSSFIDVTTRDLSTTGLSIEAPVVKVDGLHVYDSPDMVAPTRLDIEIDLPSGRVPLVGETVRYDQLGPSLYVLGVRIVEISDDADSVYGAFLNKRA